MFRPYFAPDRQPGDWRRTRLREFDGERRDRCEGGVSHTLVPSNSIVPISSIITTPSAGAKWRFQPSNYLREQHPLSAKNRFSDDGVGRAIVIHRLVRSESSRRSGHLFERFRLYKYAVHLRCRRLR